MIQQPPKYWGIPQSDLLTQLNAKMEGLSAEEAKERLAQYGANLLKPPKRSDTLALLIAQFKSPIILTLISPAGANMTRSFISHLYFLVSCTFHISSSLKQRSDSSGLMASFSMCLR